MSVKLNDRPQPGCEMGPGFHSEQPSNGILKCSRFNNLIMHSQLEKRLHVKVMGRKIYICSDSGVWFIFPGVHATTILYGTPAQGGVRLQRESFVTNPFLTINVM